MSEDLYNDIFSTDEAGNGYIRVAVVESNAPNGYMMEKNTYYMYMFFENGGENKTTEIFNDAYYVKGDHTGADKDVTLAEKQDGLPGPCIPPGRQERASMNWQMGSKCLQRTRHPASTVW